MAAPRRSGSAARLLRPVVAFVAAMVMLELSGASAADDLYPCKQWTLAESPLNPRVYTAVGKLGDKYLLFGGGEATVSGVDEYYKGVATFNIETARFGFLPTGLGFSLTGMGVASLQGEQAIFGGARVRDESGRVSPTNRAELWKADALADPDLFAVRMQGRSCGP